MRSIKKILADYSTWKFIVPSIVAFIVCIYLFQNAQNKMGEFAGEAVLLIDMRSNYDKAEITDFFTKIKPEGREIHRFTTAVVDMIFPFAYGIMFMLLTAFFLKKIAGPTSNWMYLSLLPMLLMIVDFKENLNTLALLDSYPNLVDKMVDKAASVTAIKSMLTNVCILLPIILGLCWAVKMAIARSRKKKETKKRH